jgi:hypothetical protein
MTFKTVSSLAVLIEAISIKPEASLVNQALTCELGVIPLLNAWAFTREVVVRVKGAAYCVEDCVGFVPLVV